MFTLAYPCFTLFNRVYPSLSMFYPVYSCLPLFIHVLPRFPMFTLVYPCFTLFNLVYPSLFTFYPVYLSLPKFTGSHLYHDNTLVIWESQFLYNLLLLTQKRHIFFWWLISGGAGSEVWNRVYTIAPVKKFGRVRLSTIFRQKKYGGECWHGRTISFYSVLSFPASKQQEKVFKNIFNGIFGHQEAWCLNSSFTLIVIRHLGKFSYL